MSKEKGHIEARLKEQKYFEPPEEFVEQANLTDESVYNFDFPEDFDQCAELLDWDEDYDEVLDASNPPFYKWFVGGKLNACENCVDRHLEDKKNKAAIIWEGENGETKNITYQDLYREVNKLAAALKELGVGEDDVVTLHLPMVPELPISMLACARIGAPHSEVFAGFSGEAVGERLNDAGSRYLITIDGYYRRGKLLNHKQKADEAAEMADVDHVLVWKRRDEIHPEIELEEGRDIVLNDLIEDYEDEKVEPVSRDADDILFLMYTSGTTGKPKGTQHRTGGYLAWVAWTSWAGMDIHPEDNYWCMADVGWITGHSYIVYGPLALGATTLMAEGAPDYPDKERVWRTAAKHDVDIFYTSPTAIRMFMKWGEEYPQKHDFDFKLMGTVGEPIQPEVWLWYHKYIGKEKAPIIDTWWQTETGGQILYNLPAIKPMKPGSAGLPLPGIDADVLDDEANPIESGRGLAGNLVIKKPWPGMFQTLYNNDERFISAYWEAYSNTDSDDMEDWIYKAGDGAICDDRGYYRILGRLDDVMNVAGHRLGTGELESAIAEVKEVSEPAVVTKTHPEKGSVPVAYVVLRSGVEPSDEIKRRIVKSIEREIGPFARPDEIFFTDDLPKTRSGKIMRRLLENISNSQELGDTTTLRDPSVPHQIRDQVEEKRGQA